MATLTRARLLSTTAAAAGLLLLSAIAALAVGPGPLDLGAVLSGAPGPDREILLGVRLPRVALGAFVGAALAAAGVAFQGLLRNPLADPFILGVSGGAALGGTVAIVAGAGLAALGAPAAGELLGGPLSRPLAAFLGAALSILLIHRVARAAGRGSVLSILLTGVVFNAFAAAAIMFVKSIVEAQKAQELLYWLMGTLATDDPPTALLAACGLMAAGTAALLAFTPRLNLLSLGDEAAAALGVNVGRTQTAIFVCASLTVGAAVAVTGLIGFVGLMVPHMARLLLGPDHRRLLPAAALGGGAFLVLCDAATRALFPVLSTEPPVGVITALAGGPFFLFLLARGGSRLGFE